MYEKEVTSAYNPSNRKFLREKRKSSLKFKTKNWDFGREEWNNYCCKFVLLCKLELLIDQWSKEKSNQRIVLQKGRETWRKERIETVKERDLWEEERPKLVTVRVWGEKKQKEERKSEKTYHDREKAPKNYVSHGYRRR